MERGTPIEYADCAWCSKLFVRRTRGGQRALYCSDPCKWAAAHRSGNQELRRQNRRQIDSRRRARLRGVKVERFMHEEIFERDGWICGICGEPVDPARRYPDMRSASLDHVISLATGGTHERANVQCSHFWCNSKKKACVSAELAATA